MSTHWRPTRLAELLEPVQRVEAVDPLKEYRLLGVRLDGKGPFLRETVSGSKTAAPRLFCVAPGDFIYSRLFAWRGAFGVIDGTLDGCFVSGEFPTFMPIGDRLDVRFLNHWFRLPETLAKVDADCSGSTPLTRNRFHERFFLALQIPLPPLSEQRRIVARIEEVNNCLVETGRLRKQIADELDGLRLSILASDGSCVPTPMKELLQLRQPDVSVNPDESYQFAGVYCFGRGVFRGRRLTGREFSYRRLTRLRTNDFIYPKLMAWEGAFGVVPPECDACVVSPEFPVFSIMTDRVLPEVLDTWFQSPAVWGAVAGSSTGTNVRRRRLHPRLLLEYLFPLPSRQVQLRLRSVCERIAAIQPASLSVGVNIEGLLSAVLNHVFDAECRPSHGV